MSTRTITTLTEKEQIVERERDHKTHTIKEANHIRVNKDVMNRDEGGHQLSHVYDPIMLIGSRSDWHVQREMDSDLCPKL